MFMAQSPLFCELTATKEKRISQKEKSRERARRSSGFQTALVSDSTNVCGIGKPWSVYVQTY
jgi:hypothetical protein